LLLNRGAANLIRIFVTGKSAPTKPSESAEIGNSPRTRANEALQAWDAADKLILRKLEDHHESIGDVLVVNDTWGALSTALAHRRPSTLCLLKIS